MGLGEEAMKPEKSKDINREGKQEKAVFCLCSLKFALYLHGIRFRKNSLPNDCQSKILIQICLRTLC